MFERYETGQFSLSALSKDVRHRWGTVHLKNQPTQDAHEPVLRRAIQVAGAHLRGTHPTLISPELYARAQSALHGHNRPKYRKHEIAFRGLLTCAHDDCTVTAELKKNKYVYYRVQRWAWTVCTAAFSRGRNRRETGERAKGRVPPIRSGPRH